MIAMDQIAESNLPNNRTILLVEDEKLMLRLLAKVFLQRGYRVLAVSDGEQAIEVYRRQKLAIDVVLLDVGLPKMTGWQVFAKMKVENEDVRVVIASGYLEPKRKAEMSSAGVRDFVTKPYRLDEVVQRIQSLVENNRVTVNDL
jgi:DNA-binding response OmpR family regulator